MSLIDAYTKVNGRPPSLRSLQRLNAAIEVLGIKQNDALITLLFVLEHYQELYEQIPGQIQKASDIAMEDAGAYANRAVEVAAAHAVKGLSKEVAKVANELASQQAMALKSRWIAIAMCVSACALMLAAYGGYKVGMATQASTMKVTFLAHPYASRSIST